jgi:asparagine synthase (glutamine-hydrolysing)
MRERLAFFLRRVTRGTGSRMSVDAARHGLELTEPFHDRRVVELALAVPEDLYLRGGRNRHLARVALKDVYPTEFQTRGPNNDDQIPDFQRMAKSIEHEVLDEIARMEMSQELSRYVDFAKVRTLLASRGIDDHNSGWETETHLAMHAFLSARFVEWFKRPNN